MRTGYKKVAYLILFSVAVLILIYYGLTKLSRTRNGSYVVLVSLDAYRWDYSDLYSTPNLDKIAREGVKIEQLIPSFPTKTFPNHYSIATGLFPDHHGLIDNSFLATDLGLFYRMGDRKAVENGAFYGGEPIWVTAIKQGLLSASFFWVGSEAPIQGISPTYWKQYDESVSYEARIDTVVKWISYPAQKRPELVTLYFDEPDATSHDYGPVSEETGKVVSHLDSLIGVLRYKLSSLPVAKKINLIVLSDHGMSPVSAERYINIRDVLPSRMIASFSGGNPVYLISPVEDKKDSVLLLLNSVKGMKAWQKDSLPARWHYGTNQRIPEIVAVADSSWSIGIRPDASSIHGGAHGYDNYNSDMFSIFYAVGPSFKKAYSQPELNNVDIYNLICKILKLTPAENDGDPDHIKALMK